MPFPIKVALPESILAPVAEITPDKAAGEEKPITPPGPKTYALTKNFNPTEDVKLLDGSTFRFPSAEFVTSDEVLYKKLLAVADKYRIVKRDLD